MRTTAIIGIILIVLGGAGIAAGQIRWTETKPVAKAGPLELDTKEHHQVSIPTIGSIVLLVVGAGLLIAGRRPA